MDWLGSFIPLGVCMLSKPQWKCSGRMGFNSPWLPLCYHPPDIWEVLAQGEISRFRSWRGRENRHMTWHQARICKLHFQMSQAWLQKTGLLAEKYTEQKPKKKNFESNPKSKFTGLNPMASTRPFLLGAFISFGLRTDTTASCFLPPYPVAGCTTSW